MYTDWRYTKYAGYYHPRTFTHVKRNNTTDMNNKYGGYMPKASEKFFFASNVDIQKYNDKHLLVHLAMLSAFYVEFHDVFPTELFYFAVLFLIPKLDEKPDKDSAISEVLSDSEVRSQLMILKSEYEKQRVYKIKNILSFGYATCRSVTKEEFELYRLIRQNTVAGDFRLIFINKDSDFSLDRDYIKIPKDIKEKVSEHEFEDVYSYYPEIDMVDLCFKQKISSYDHLKKAKVLYEKDRPKVYTKNIKRKFSSRAVEMLLMELLIAMMLSYPASWVYLRVFKYTSTMYLAFFDTIMKHFMFSDVMYFVILAGLYLIVYFNISRTALSPSCYFAVDRIVCSAVNEWDSYNPRARDVRKNLYVSDEHFYTYTYSSIKEYGTFRRMGKKYFYFSKKRLTDDEFNNFRNKIILCDENTVAMSYDEKVFEIAKQILPLKKTE